MSGSEIRASLEAVNWDTNIAVKNLKIDKLYRFELPLVRKNETNMPCPGLVWRRSPSARRCCRRLVGTLSRPLVASWTHSRTVSFATTSLWSARHMTAKQCWALDWSRLALHFGQQTAILHKSSDWTLGGIA